MKIGLDIGNADCKTDGGIIIPTKFRTGESFNSNATIVTFDGVTYTIGEGNREVEINKADKKSNLMFIYTLIALSSYDVDNEIGLGLPVSQYLKEKDKYRDYILANNRKTFVINGRSRTINITNVKVFPEGIQTLDSSFNGIIVDIGGHSTDIALVENRKIINPITKPRGVLNLYNDITNEANRRFSLDLQQEDGMRVLKGFKVDGNFVDIRFANDIMSDFVNDIINTLKLNYSLRSNDVTLIGGGAELFFNSFKRKVNYVTKGNDCVFANAKAFRRGL